MTPSTISPSNRTGTSNSPTVATISLSALAHNVQETRRLLQPGCTIMAIVKADAYGHGGIVITKSLSKLGIPRFGVATIQEGVALREAGIQEEIIILGGQFAWQLADLVHFQLTPVISDVEIVEHLIPLVKSLPHPYPVHLKVDTGMARLGLAPQSISSLQKSNEFGQFFLLQGIMTHLAEGDNEDQEGTCRQMRLFQEMVDRLKKDGMSIPPLSVANTAGILFHPTSHFDIVRPGLMLFGYPPVPRRDVPAELKPVMRLTTNIVQIRTVEAHQPLSYNGIFKTQRKSRIAVLPIGYANGYSRRLSNKGEVLVGKRRAPIVGQICMDMMLIDITDLPEVQKGEEVVLLGNQGDHVISALDLASWQDTAPYEVLCNLGTRVNRVYESL
ncbi:MAG: alanine racemase [Nitrospirota bacterium]|nr:alanine racemase [Nitrospirota bacterium]